MIRSFLWAAAPVILLTGCPPPMPSGDAGPPIVPADYASWNEVRDCRRSPDHDLAYIRVFASPDAEPVYVSREGAFPEGAVLLKLEYADPDCTDLSGMTAMAWRGGDWQWQELSAARVPFTESTERCAGCHEDCGEPPDGYLGTCTAP